MSVIGLNHFFIEQRLLPYVGVGFNPIEGSALFVGAKFSQRKMDASSARINTRDRQEFTVGYSFDLNDQLTFSPKVTARHNSYAAKNTRDTEWRIFPNMSYQLNDTFSLALDGFLAPVGARDEARGSDAVDASESDRFDYTDYKHELEFRLNTRLADDKRLMTSFYNEFSRKYGHSASSTTETQRNEWQLRVVYTQDFGNFSLSPFARITLHREAQNNINQTKDELRNRFGVVGNYNLTNQLDLVGEIYHQFENQRDWTNTAVDDGKKRMMFYKVGLKYNF